MIRCSPRACSRCSAVQIKHGRGPCGSSCHGTGNQIGPAARPIVRLEQMAIRTELNLRLANSPGASNEVCRLLADERVRIHAMMLEAGGTLRLLVDSPVRAAGRLRERWGCRRRARRAGDVAAQHAGDGLGPSPSRRTPGICNVDTPTPPRRSRATRRVIVLGVDAAARASMSACCS